ncbi:UNVERIFIED_CONTAM: hypothetical protein GTU68_041208 [Idotea baltica]|nr:hypothetical protein [Idotea baltica]
MKHVLQEETKFEIAFPKYREKYLRECWPIVKKVLDEQGINCDLNLLEGVMSVATTRKTWDPYLILKARDIIKLLGRSVPVEQAVRVLKDNITCEIVKIKNLVRNKERLVKRRQRLIGSNGTALKTLELLTDCYVLVQGCTVAAIGPHKGVQQVVRVVLDTMKNIHPINLLKALMVKRSLAKDPEKKNEDWTKYIPSHASSNPQRKKPRKTRTTKPYTPFPPEREERKQDLSMQSGRFFVEEGRRKGGKRGRGGREEEERKRRAGERQRERRGEAFMAPPEPAFAPQGLAKTGADVDVTRLKKKLKDGVK